MQTKHKENFFFPSHALGHRKTIEELVALVDQLRQPYNNGNRHDLYLLATDTLNRLEEEGRI